MPLQEAYIFQNGKETCTIPDIPMDLTILQAASHHTAQVTMEQIAHPGIQDQASNVQLGAIDITHNSSRNYVINSPDQSKNPMQDPTGTTYSSDTSNHMQSATKEQGTQVQEPREPSSATDMTGNCDIIQRSTNFPFLYQASLLRSPP